MTTAARYGEVLISETLWTGSTDVPHSFLGMVFHRWPGTSAAPFYNYGTCRIHDYDGCQWRDLHVGPGQFKWDRLDVVIEAQIKCCKEISYSLWGTPQWCSSRPNEADIYGGMGGSAPPTDTAYVREFISAMLKRYKGKIQYLECWNEPSLDGKGYWTGDASQLVGVARAVYAAANKVTCLGPSFSGFLEVPWFLNAVSPEGDGFGGDFIDAIAFHPYGTNLQRFPKTCDYSVVNGDGTPQWHDSYLRDRMVEGGLPRDFPIYGMEQGITGDHNAQVLKDWAPEQKARYVAGVTAQYAALGWKKVTWYAHDDELCGAPYKNQVVMASLDWCSSLGGKSITGIHRTVDGAILVDHHEGAMIF